MLTRFENYGEEEPVISEAGTVEEADRMSEEYRQAGMNVSYLGRKFIPNAQGGVYESIYGVFPTFRRPKCEVGDVVRSCGKIYIVIATSKELGGADGECPKLLMRRMDDPNEPAVYATDDLVEKIGHQSIFGSSSPRLPEGSETVKETKTPTDVSIGDHSVGTGCCAIPKGHDTQSKKRRRSRTANRTKAGGTPKRSVPAGKDGNPSSCNSMETSCKEEEPVRAVENQNVEEEWIMTEDGFVLSKDLSE